LNDPENYDAGDGEDDDEWIGDMGQAEEVE